MSNIDERLFTKIFRTWQRQVGKLGMDNEAKIMAFVDLFQTLKSAGMTEEEMFDKIYYLVPEIAPFGKTAQSLARYRGIIVRLLEQAIVAVYPTVEIEKFTGDLGVNKELADRYSAASEKSEIDKSKAFDSTINAIEDTSEEEFDVEQALRDVAAYEKNLEAMRSKLPSEVVNVKREIMSDEQLREHLFGGGKSDE